MVAGGGEGWKLAVPVSNAGNAYFVLKKRALDI
jgi:hypothetical protein